MAFRLSRKASDRITRRRLDACISTQRRGEGKCALRMSPLIPTPNLLFKERLTGEERNRRR